MAKYEVLFENDLECNDAIFDTYKEAEEYGYQVMSEIAVGAEILHMSNPGDYPLNDEFDGKIIFSICETDD